CHHPLAVAAERRAPHGGGIPFQDGDLLAALRIPDARGVVERPCYQPLAVAADARLHSRPPPAPTLPRLPTATRYASAAVRHASAAPQLHLAPCLLPQVARAPSQAAWPPPPRWP